MREKLMNYSMGNIARFMLFVTVTIAELMLVVFLFLYGSSSLQLFGLFLLIVQLLSLHLIYTYTAGMFTSAFKKPKTA